MFTPSRRPIPRNYFIMMCWAYIAVGVASIAMGLFVGGLPVYLTRQRGVHIDPAVLALALFFVLFGLARIGLAARNLLRIRRRPAK